MSRCVNVTLLCYCWIYGSTKGKWYVNFLTRRHAAYHIINHWHLGDHPLPGVYLRIICVLHIWLTITLTIWLVMTTPPRHAGSSALGNLPVHRGFKSSLGYMGGAEDHYTQIGDYKEKSPDSYSTLAVYGDERDDQVDYRSIAGTGGIVDMWDTDGPAYG